MMKKIFSRATYHRTRVVGLLAYGTRALAEASNLVGYKNAEQDYRHTDKHRRLVMEHCSLLLCARKLTDGRTHRKFFSQEFLIYLVLTSTAYWHYLLSISSGRFSLMSSSHHNLEPLGRWHATTHILGCYFVKICNQRLCVVYICGTFQIFIPPMAAGVCHWIYLNII